MQLSTQQIDYFQTFGFIKLENIFATEIDWISQRFDNLFAHRSEQVIDWVHEAHYNKIRKVLMQFIENDSELVNLVDHPVVDGIFSSLLGNDYLYRTSEGNIFSSDTYWHTDLYNIDFNYQHLKMLFYLDPVDTDSGCLRVIPGSHHWDDSFARTLEKNVYTPEKNYGLSAADIPATAVPTKPGDLIVFDYRLKHATCNTKGPRRMMTICASERFADSDLPSLAKLMGELKAYTGMLYGPEMIDKANTSRMRHLQQCLDCEALIVN